MTARPILPVADWARDHCTADATATATLTDLHDAYVFRARQGGHGFIARGWFSRDLAKLPGVAKGRDENTRSGYGWEGDVKQVTIGAATLYLGDCRDVLPTLGKVDAVVTDPPYPNNAGHFVDGIDAARECLLADIAEHWFVFWTEMETPRAAAPHVATHIWYRTTTNRPDNYEPIYEYHTDGRKRASRVLPYCVIFPGLTGIEATGHPTEKHPGLMRRLIRSVSGETIIDPFMGSGTTGVAAVTMGRKFTGIEIEPRYFDIACRRIEEAQRQGDMFIKPAESAA